VLGHESRPFDGTLAKLADDTYRNDSGIPGWNKVSDSDLRASGISPGLLENPVDGFKSAIYTDGNGHYVLAYRGSTPADFAHPTGAFGTGANPSAADQLGNTALHVAGQINAGQYALDLLDAGADPSSVNRQGVTFQRYLFMTPEDILTDDARRQRGAVRTWLRAHAVPVEGDSPVAR
ncbi:MAG TPA: hypothetical protein VNO21_04205, partial [Polyangiaceae bacterium]|nr:hypothetical protein [Polyangiaceae bacterium]